MIYKVRSAPHIHGAVSNRTLMGDMIVTLLALYIICIFLYGIRPLLLGLACVASCALADALGIWARHERFCAGDLSPVVTGMIIPLMLPASAPNYIPIVAGFFGILVAKQAFGGLGRNLFDPAAAGLAFVSACWPDAVFLYPTPLTRLEAWQNVTAKLTNGAAYLLDVGGVPTTDHTSVILGLYTGPMGTTNVLVVAACLLYLVLRGTVRWQQPVATLAAAALFSLLFPISGLSAGASVFYELFATPVLFVAAFLLADPVTSPKRDLAKVIYGALGGILLMLFSRVGAYPLSAAFVILVMNALTPVLDQSVERLTTLQRRA